jgi:capsular exopolysaccharide synthesis family protein
MADGSEQAIDLKAELAKLEADMETAAEAELTTLRQQVASAQARSTDLRGQLRSGVLQSDLPAALLTNIYELQQNAELARTQYQTLLSRTKDLEVQASLQVPDSRVVSVARAPTEPSFPNPRLILGIAGIVALGLGIGLAFLAENFIGGFSSEEQMRSVLRATSVVSAPKQRSSKGPLGGGVGVADLVIQSPLSAFAEALRRIRIGIDNILKRRPSADGGMAVMVTSAVPNEGKTTLSLALARTYALSGRSTLLIDCDMRKPSVHQHLGLDPSSGLLEYLADEHGALPLASIMVTDGPSGAQVIVGARPSDFATDHLVTSAAFRRLIKAARENFEVVILDTPPIGPVVDGLYLAQFADVAVYVVRWASTSQQDARGGFNALAEVLPSGTEILAVLNQQDRSRASYRYAYSGYYTEA